ISKETMAVDLSMIRKICGGSPLSLIIWIPEVATQVNVDREAQKRIRALLHCTVLLTVFLLVPEPEFSTHGNLMVLKSVLWVARLAAVLQHPSGQEG
ncbi:unnamed protein product, partial [Bubo scandiacus]